MIPKDEYVRIVLGTRSTLRAMKLLIGDLPLKMDQRRNILSKIHSLCDDNHTQYMDLKEGLI